VTWINPAGGNWDTPSNWNTGALPGAGDDVIIPVLNNGASVTHSQNVTDTIKSLTASSTLALSGGTLDLSGAIPGTTGSMSDTSSITLAGGTLANATVATGTDITATDNSTLTGVTLAGQLTVISHNFDPGSVTVTVNQGLTLSNGTVLLNGVATGNGQAETAILLLAGTGTQTLGGTGQVVFAGTHHSSPDQLGLLESSAGPLTVGSGISVVDTTAGGTLGNAAEALTVRPGPASRWP
jgi:hypothetical protein